MTKKQRVAIILALVLSILALVVGVTAMGLYMTGDHGNISAPANGEGVTVERTGCHRCHS